MDVSRRRLLLAALPALVQPPPDASEYINRVRSCLVAVVMPPLNPVLDIRHRLFSNDSNIYSGRNVFQIFSANRYNFYNLTGETPETLIDMLQIVNLRNNSRHKLSPVNRILLFVIWIRCYPTLMTLSAIFNVCTAYVHVEIRIMIRTFYAAFSHYITWPTIDQWLSKRGDWDKLYPAVGAIDGTSHEILRPMNVPHTHTQPKACFFTI
ncbi:uncharacterized protein LOC132712764 [Ruditapes philippinarum]|uniref:uncharacterized protein LOC132712764 n=1 Tax=Ruditapes philippinarum TaxID=129788 RepID=UPI00295A9EDF|nr:uncharacterized protein LOC132712764 [Ruditapes philippinarum]